jgi:hypothetical protein
LDNTRATCTIEDAPTRVAVCFSRCGSVRSSSLDFHLLRVSGIKGAAFHRRSWVTAFLDLADMGGGGRRRFSPTAGASFAWFVSFLPAFHLGIVAAFAGKHLSTFYICFFLMPRGYDCYWKGAIPKGGFVLEAVRRS